jgi:hypothetical protein
LLAEKLITPCDTSYHGTTPAFPVFHSGQVMQQGKSTGQKFQIKLVIVSQFFAAFRSQKVRTYGNLVASEQ